MTLQASPDLQKVFDEALRHHRNGLLSDAERLYRQILQADPGHIDALHLLGLLAHQLGRNDIAIDLISQAIARNGQVSIFHNSLGNAQRALGQFDEAISSYGRALSRRPDYAEAHYNLGLTHYARGNLTDAIAAYERAIGYKSDLTEAHNNLGIALHARGQLREAVLSYERAVKHKPDYAEAYHNRGLVFGAQVKLDEAFESYQRALILKPDYAEAYLNLGSTLKDQGRLDGALAAYGRALAVRPDYAEANSNILLTMVYAPFVSATDLFAASCDFAARLADPWRRLVLRMPESDVGRPLRIGYVSGDFRTHAAAYSVQPLLSAHDRRRFTIYAYSNTRQADALTERLKACVDHWRDIQSLSDDAAADLISADRIDILVDLSGHTADNRLLVFARKPAPIQVTWLGYPATTGLAAMDYRITDAHADPVGMTEHLYTETLWRLPGFYCCYQAGANSPPVIDHPPADDNGHVTFGCFNNYTKLTDPVLSLWGRILDQVPHSRLLLELKGLDQRRFKAEIEQRLARSGLPLERVVLEPRRATNQYALYNRIDIALDPFPCNGGTTSLDALWMGVPFVTLAGGQFVARMGVTILKHAGLSELIADSPDEYVRLAVGLATDRTGLRDLRKDLRARIAYSPLMDQRAFARQMEDAYRKMWLRWTDPGRAQ